VLARLPDYLADAAARSRGSRPVTGIATDGATFIAYALRDGALRAAEARDLAHFTVSISHDGGFAIAFAVLA